MQTAQKIYNMSKNRLKRFWLDYSFAGKGQAPISFNSQAELKNFVARNPGAIGIIDQSNSTGDIKVVTIDGKNVL
jgi:hypothetical protein